MNSEEKDYIEGIYNYCDRWCEKCGFTTHCFLFTQESRIKTYEILHNGSLSGIEEMFKKDTGSAGDEHTGDKSTGGDFVDEEFLDSLEENEDNEDNSSDREELKEPEHPINNLLDEYFNKAYIFIEALNKKYNIMGLSKEKVKSRIEEDTFRDFEVFAWFYTFIGAKLKRALFGLFELRNEEEEELKEIHKYDMNGSAKIGIIAVKRSIQALNNLHKNLPDYFADTEELLILLGKILNAADELFPDCMEFKRPGFDV